MTLSLDHFEQLYQHSPDPWSTATRWYERRKRSLLLASLQRERYRHGFEPGCGIGETTSDLMERCDQLCAVDSSERAVWLCHRDIEKPWERGLDLRIMALPSDWPPVPPGGFDLIVVSELAFRLAASAWRATRALTGSCTPALAGSPSPMRTPRYRHASSSTYYRCKPRTTSAL